MRKAGFDPRRAINGNYGEVMLDGELVREATALQAKAQINFKDVPMCGTSGKKQKSAGWSGQYYYDENEQPHGIENCG